MDAIVAVSPTFPVGSPVARQPKQLLPRLTSLQEAMRLLFRNEVVSGVRLVADLFEPYAACRWCVAGSQWCTHGRALGSSGAPSAADTSISPTSPIDGAGSSFAPTALGALGALRSPAGIASRLRMGRQADPYPAAESAAGRTRSFLERLLEAGTAAAMPAPRLDVSLLGDLELSILTRSPLLGRDVDLLAELDQRHYVSVDVKIPAGDDKLIERLEGRSLPAPPADERFDLVHRLAGEGLAVRVVCSPLTPGINNSHQALLRLVSRARQAGAHDVIAAPRHPALPPTPYEAEQLLATFSLLRLEHGFPAAVAGRG